MKNCSVENYTEKADTYDRSDRQFTLPRSQNYLTNPSDQDNDLIRLFFIKDNSQLKNSNKLKSLSQKEYCKSGREELSILSDNTTHELRKKIKKKDKARYYMIKKNIKETVFQGNSENIMAIMTKKIARCNSYNKLHLKKSQVKQFNLHFRKKLIIDQSQLKPCKSFQTKAIFKTEMKILMPDKIIRFSDCQQPLNSKYLNPSELTFGYKPFSRMRYLKKIESISRDSTKNKIFVQLVNINDDKLKAEEENIQSNLLKYWLENLDTPESNKQADILNDFKSRISRIKYYNSFIQTTAPNSINFINKINKATIRNIKKFINFTLVFATDIRKEGLNFSLHQIELNQSVCDLIKLDSDCQRNKHEFVYEFLDMLFTMDWIKYYSIQLNHYVSTTQKSDCYKVQEPCHYLKRGCLYQYDIKKRISNHFSSIFLETVTQDDLILFKFVHVLKKKRPIGFANKAQ